MPFNETKTNTNYALEIPLLVVDYLFWHWNADGRDFFTTGSARTQKGGSLGFIYNAYFGRDSDFHGH